MFRSSLLFLPLCLLAFAGQPEPKPKEGDWPLSRRTPEQAGVAESKLPAKLTVLWKFAAGDAFENSVAVVGQVVVASCMDECVYALDLDKGQQKWKYKADKSAPFKAPPSIRNGHVHVGDLDGFLHCIDDKGAKKWIFEAGTELGGANYFGTNVLAGSHDEHLYCVTGEGKEHWKFKTDGPIYGSVAVAAGKTFLVGCDSKMHVIDIQSGKEERAVELGGQTAATAAVFGDLLYVGTMKNEVKAIDWKKGEEVWTYRPARNAQAFYSSAAVDAKYVILGGRDNLVHCLDRKSGNMVWTFATGNKVDSSPVIAGNRVVVGSLDGHLYVLDLATGKEVQKVDLGGPIAAAPVVVGGKVLIGTQKGVLYCLGEKK